MDTRSAYRFVPSTTLEKEIALAMKRMEESGITYPEGYYDRLVEKYRREEILYPFALMLAGTPRIRNHFAYLRVIKRAGRFLDYGCGAGDSVRILIRDGFPREKITAFDVNWSGINLGFDLNLDRERLSGLFVVSGRFPFRPAAFDTVFSGHVIHCIVNEDELMTYLKNAYTTLRPGGIFFGTTMGIVVNAGRLRRGYGLERLLSHEALKNSLADAGFHHIIIREHPVMPGHIFSLMKKGFRFMIPRTIIRYFLGNFDSLNNHNRYILRFCAEKPKESCPDP